MDTFAERLRKARIQRGLSQAQLARACGLSQSAISSYENGSRQSPKKLLNLAQTLDVDIYWLSRGDGTPNRQPDPGIPHHEHYLPWPFASIEPEQYWSLSIRDRQTVETTLLALIQTLQGSK